MKAKKLWAIRQKAIASGMELLNEAEIEQELTERRVDTVSLKKVT